MNDDARGGWVPGPPVMFRLALDECVLDRAGRCLRKDAPHRIAVDFVQDWITVTILGEKSATRIPGRRECRHAHSVAVESTVTGDEIARLCPTCDMQLPAGWLA